MALTVGELVAFLRVDKGQYSKGLAEGRAEAHAAGRDIGRSLEVEVDRDGSLNRYAQKLRDVRTLYTAGVKPIRDYSAQVAGLAVKAGVASVALGGGVGLAGVLSSLIFSLGSVGAALPVVAVGILGVAAISKTAKVALAGVGDALDDKIGDAFDKISPKAQRFVDEFGQLVPMLVKAKNAIQDSLFGGLDKTLGPLAKTYLPLLTKNGSALADALNGAAGIAAAGLLDPKTVTSLNTVLDKLGGILEGFVPSLRGVIPLLAQVLLAGIPGLERLGAKAGGVVDRFKKAVADGIQSGGLERAITGGLNAAAQLGGVLADVMVILFRIGQAGHEAFGNPLGELKDLTDGVRQWVSSAKGQASVTAVFRLFAPVLAGIGDVLQLLAPEVLSLLPVIRDLALAFLTGLKPVVPVLGDVARTLGEALVPLLPIVSKFAVLLGDFLVQALDLLAPLIPPIGDALVTLLSPTGLLIGLLAALKPVLTPLAQGLGEVVTILAGGLLKVVEALAPSLPGLVDAFVALAITVSTGLASALEDIAPYLPQIVDAFTQLVIALIPLVPTVAELVPYVLELLPPLVSLAASILPLVAEGFSLLAAWAVALAPHLGFLKPILEGLIVAWIVLGTQSLLQAARIAAAWLIAMGPIGAVILAVVGVAALIIANWGRIKAVTAAVWSWIVARVGSVWPEIKVGLAIMANGIAMFFYDLPGRIRGWLGNMGGVLLQAGKDILRGLITGLESAVPGLKATLNFVTKIIPDWKGPPERDAELLRPAGRSIIRGLVSGVQAEVPELRRTLNDVTALIPADANALSVRANREATAALAATRPAPAARDDVSKAPTVELGDIHVYIGDQEITEMIRVEVGSHGRATAATAYAGSGRRAG